MSVRLVVIGGNPEALRAQYPVLARVEGAEGLALSWVADPVEVGARAGELTVFVTGESDGAAVDGAALVGGGRLWAGALAEAGALVEGLLALAERGESHEDQFAHLGLILAGVVHDLRSPLSFMVSRAELGVELVDELRETSELGELDAIADNFAGIERHARSAIELVHSVLETAKGTAVGTVRVVLDAEMLRLVELVQLPRGVELALALDADKAEIEVGPRDFARIVLNLVHNAQQALAGTSSRATIVVSTRVEPELVELSVADNGAGVPPEARERIFEPSYSTTGGTGLGLAIVKRLVETHGASIALDHAHVEGARFVIRFPRCDRVAKTPP